MVCQVESKAFMPHFENPSSWKTRAASVRLVQVRKDADASFGAVFAAVGQHLHVVRLEQYADLKLSAAYRAGIKFGDRLNKLDGVIVNANTDLDDLHAHLKTASVVTVEIDERPVDLKCAQVVGVELFGVELSREPHNKGTISYVWPRSVASEAGFAKGDVIFQVNQQCVLGLTEAEIRMHISNARKNFVFVEMVAILGPLARALREACKRCLDSLGMRNTPCHVFVNQSLKVDKNISTVTSVIVKGSKFGKLGKAAYKNYKSHRERSAPNSPVMGHKGRSSSMQRLARAGPNSAPASPIMGPGSHRGSMLEYDCHAL